MTTVDRQLRALASETRRAALEAAVRELFDLKAKGDFEQILERIAPDFVYRSSGAWTKAPYLSAVADRKLFSEALWFIIVEFEELRSEIHELLIDGDRVAVHRTVHMRNRGAGGAMDVDMWHHFRFRDGLLVEYAVYFDAARLQALQLASAIEP